MMLCDIHTKGKIVIKMLSLNYASLFVFCCTETICFAGGSLKLVATFAPGESKLTFGSNASFIWQGIIQRILFILFLSLFLFWFYLHCL